ncbi:MAG TPA: hypothetical protein VI248_19810, partial [Kineosporiaceae bacterium]
MTAVPAASPTEQPSGPPDGPLSERPDPPDERRLTPRGEFVASLYQLQRAIDDGDHRAPAARRALAELRRSLAA